MGKGRDDAGRIGQDQSTGKELKRVKEYRGVLDKEKMELMNLRKRVQAQREEIKKLREEIERLKQTIRKYDADFK